MLLLAGDIGWGVGVQYYLGVIFDLAKMFSTVIFETYFSYLKDIWIPAANYCISFYLIVLSPLTAILQLRNFTA